MIIFSGNKIKGDLKEMRHEGQIQSDYTVNGEVVFDKSKKHLQEIFNDFPNKGRLVYLVLLLKRLYFGFILFILQY